MSRQVELLFPTHLDCIDKKNLQCPGGRACPGCCTPSAPNNIWVKEGRRDLGEMEKLFEEKKQRKTEPCIELLLAKMPG